MIFGHPDKFCHSLVLIRLTLKGPESTAPSSAIPGGDSRTCISRSWACLCAGALRLLYFLSFYDPPG